MAVTVTVKDQKELDEFLNDATIDNFMDIHIPFKDAVLSYRAVSEGFYIRLLKGASIKSISGGYHVYCEGNNTILAMNGGEAILEDNCKIFAGNTDIMIRGNNCEIYGHHGSRICCWSDTRDSFIYLEGNACVNDAYSSIIIANNHSAVTNSKNCVIKLRDFSTLNGLYYTFLNNTVYAYNNSVVKITNPQSNKFIGYHNSIFYCPDSFNKEIVDLHDNSKWVCLDEIGTTDRLKEFLESREIKVDENGDCYLFKAVHKNGKGIYYSDFDPSFIYKIGEVVYPKDPCDLNLYEECGSGIHVATLEWAKSYGNWPDLAILKLKVNIEDIVFPYWATGKMRAKKAKVIREVSLGELNKIFNF